MLTKEQIERLKELTEKSELTEEEKKEKEELEALKKKPGETDDEQDQQGNLSRDDVESMLERVEKKWQSRFDKVNTEKTSLKQQIEELQKEKLNEEEKVEYELKKKEEKLLKQQKELEDQKISMLTRDLLKEKNLPYEFKDFLISDTEDKTRDVINTFKNIFDKKIQEEVDRIFKERGEDEDRGTSGETPSSNPFLPGKNYNLTEQARLFNEEPDLAKSLQKKAQKKAG